MPIGKNSIKRVQNNGYSSLKSTAPDMENSTVAAEPEKAVKSTPVSKKSAQTASKRSKTAAHSAKKATTQTEKKAKKKPAAKGAPKAEPAAAAAQPVREGDGYINLGGDMPYYLL